MMTTKSRRKKQRLDCRRGLVAISAALFGALVSTSARASLTSSEVNQVREFYAAAKPNDASQVRALVARPDLTAEESAAALSTAIGGVAFTPARAAFLHALVFDGASLASRSVLALATTQGVLARSNDVMAKFEGDFDAHADAVSEVQRIFVFVDQEIASASPQRGLGAAPASGISEATYDDCATAIADALTLHPKWMKVDAKLSPVAERVRAQAQLALYDMMNDSPTFRVDAADKLGLAGPRRLFFLQLGVLILDDGHASDKRVDQVSELFARLPAARVGVEAVFFGDEKPGLVGGSAKHKEIIAVKGSLDPLPNATLVNLAPDDIPAEATADALNGIDPALADLARDLSVITVQRALQNRGDLALQATRDARAAIDGKIQLGKMPAASPLPVEATAVLAQAVEMIVIDFPATFRIAKSRFDISRPEPAALLSDALGILAVYASPAQVGEGLTLSIGRRKDDGTSTYGVLKNVALAPSGAATAFDFNKSPYRIARDTSGDVKSVSSFLPRAPYMDSK